MFIKLIGELTFELKKKRGVVMRRENSARVMRRNVEVLAGIPALKADHPLKMPSGPFH